MSGRTVTRLGLLWAIRRRPESTPTRRMTVLAARGRDAAQDSSNTAAGRSPVSGPDARVTQRRCDAEDCCWSTTLQPGAVSPCGTTIPLTEPVAVTWRPAASIDTVSFGDA